MRSGSVDATALVRERRPADQLDGRANTLVAAEQRSLRIRDESLVVRQHAKALEESHIRVSATPADTGQGQKGVLNGAHCPH